MPIENETANRNYPLPAGANDLVDDVERIIDAFEGIDTDVAALLASLSSKAGLTSPVFDGVPQAPTAVSGTSSAQIATTAFVAGEIDALDIDIDSEFDAVDASLAKRVRVDSVQSFTEVEKGRGRANLGLRAPYNYIINGDFLIFQRATSQTTSGYGSDDRWANQHSGSTKTHSQQAFTIGQTDVPGNPQAFSRTVVSSAAGASNFVAKTQRIEGVTRLSGLLVTVTFWAKADAARQLSVDLSQVFGTGGSPSAAVVGIGVQKFSLTTAWQKFTFTATLPSVAGKALGNDGNSFTALSFWFDAGSDFNARTSSLGHQSGTFDIAHVSLVENDATAKADPSPQLSYDEVWALCQRYARMISRIEIQAAPVSGQPTRVNVPLSPRMRVQPTVVSFTPDGGSGHGWEVSVDYIRLGAFPDVNGFTSATAILLDAEL